MISAVVITLNEEKNINRALGSLQNLVDEIIVVDSGSTDDTLEIAKSFGAKIYFHKFENFSSQKNWALSQANGDWILSCDADEEIPDGLVDEIKQAVKNDQFAGYFISRRNFILGKEIKHSRWSPDTHIWLWKKDKGRWVGDVHEEVKVFGKVGYLKNKKIHYQDGRMRSFLDSNNHYSSLLAESLFKRGIRFSYFRLFWDPIFEFFLRFIYKLGFLDGWHGFALAYLMGVYKLIVWIKIYELQNIKGKK